MNDDASTLAPVLAAYAFSPASALRALEGGLINRTYLVEEGGRRAVLQRLHPIFAPSVHLDIEAVTAHLALKGLLTPRLIPTTAGALWISDAQGAVWRMLSWLEGHTLHALQRPESARGAGELVGRFHQAVSDLRHDFHFTRPGAHDTPRHVAHLREVLGKSQSHRKLAAIAPVAESLLRHAEQLDALPALPVRLVHGDLKISNLLFDDAHERARALLDLDTFANLNIPVELGDAFRSWCNPAGEDATGVQFRSDLFTPAIEGYASAARALLVPEERETLVLAIETVALELSCRFCGDALEESYFGWNPAKFASRSDHNLARAQSQLALARSVNQQRPALEAIVRRTFAG